ncbi:hypothetical protein AGMMS50293_29730 [Spirochaetia bacterium]|nr:hypothetical protein AGMMS50293_29730 [Spirochaetia bacterium]
MCNNDTRRAEAENAYIAAVDAYAAANYVKSLELINKAIALDRNFYQAIFLEGKIHFFMDQLPEAEAIFSRLDSKYPAFTEARIWNIRCLILREDYAKAKTLLDRELSFNQTDWRVYTLYALLAQKTNNYEERISMNRRAESVLSGSASVYMDTALTWHSLGLEDRAKTYLEKARALTGTNVSLQELEKAMNTALFKE